ncbi:GSCOCT00013030001.2-RA-CDS [Cotesia congregata]|uniref:Cc_bv19.1_19.4b n=1 Tax=Cotesia congregata TaxID=51543 RepID=S6CVK3_COTCN|nr:GSCOCT00013030001.2-RA-CDS [Cotesia congregata]CAG5092318.1 cc_bv19.1_19.4b [Cotesia congregata]CCQ71073.1 hypothetical protein BV19-1 [Cotesia congregata]
MLFNKAVIVLCIFILSISWIQAISVEKEKELSLPENISRLVTQNYTSELTTEENRSSNDSASKLITFTDDNSLSEKDSSADNYSSGVDSDSEDDLSEEGSGTGTHFSGDGSNDTDDSSSEEYYDNKDYSTEYEYDAKAEDDNHEVTSPLPVTTTEEFTFEEPASTTVAIEDASEKAGSANQPIPLVIIIAVPISAVILLLILLILLKIYCASRKATQERDGADQTFITVDKFMTIKN